MHDTFTSLRHRLKQATAALHEALDRRVGPLQSQNEYNEYARGMLAFREGAESWLDASAYCTGDWRPQRLAGELALDIRDLALTPVHSGFSAWRAESESFAMGVHYVLEGSALGARILCQRVEPLGLGREYGARHLWAQAEHPHGFRGFLNLLSARSIELNEAHVIAGANAAFSAAARAMECARA